MAHLDFLIYVALLWPGDPERQSKPFLIFPNYLLTMNMSFSSFPDFQISTTCPG